MTTNTARDTESGLDGEYIPGSTEWVRPAGTTPCP